MQGSKYNNEIREKALAMLAANDNASEVARDLGLPKSTVCSWKREKKKDDEFADIRRKRQKAFINNAWKGIETAYRIAQKRLELAETYTDRLQEILERCEDVLKMKPNELQEFRRAVLNVQLQDISDIMKVVNTLYDKGMNLEDRMDPKADELNQKYGLAAGKFGVAGMPVIIFDESGMEKKEDADENQ